MPKKPARGRPAKASVDNKSGTFSMRIEPELLVRIDHAARRAGKSRSAFIVNAVKSKLDEAAEHRDDIHAVMNLCAKVVETVEHFTGQKWYENSFLTMTVGHVIQGLLTHYSGDKPITVPEKISTHEKLRMIRLVVPEPPSTPAEFAPIVQFVIIDQLEKSAEMLDPKHPWSFNSPVVKKKRGDPQSERAKDAAIWRALNRRKN
jgi:predicted transcriptional regulator